MVTKILFTLVILIILSNTVSAALNDTGDTTLVITSTPPTISSVELNDASTGDEQIDLTPATITELNCWGIAGDSDGLNDISIVTAEIFGPTGSLGSSDHDDYHYSNNSCSYDNTTGAYNCTFPDVQFYAENGSWNCTVNVSDFAVNSVVSSDLAAINQLLAIDIPDATEVNFGSIQVGQSSLEQSVTLENEGNIEIDIETDVYMDNESTLNTDAMNCTTGRIPATNINASLTSGSGYSLMVTTGLLTLNANLAHATGNDQIPTTDIIYLTLEVPAGGVAGTCDGTIFFGATLS